VNVTGEFTIYPDAAEKVVNTPECRAWLYRIAQVGVQLAQSQAPAKTGAYRDSIHATILPNQEHPAAAIAASDFKWWWIEAGTISQPAHRVLATAGAQVSQRYVPEV
jgi:hypothetical protein